MRRKCKECGERVTGLETEAVRIIDNKTKRIKDVVCSSCAALCMPRIKNPAHYKSSWGSFTKTPSRKKFKEEGFE